MLSMVDTRIQDWSLRHIHAPDIPIAAFKGMSSAIHITMNVVRDRIHDASGRCLLYTIISLRCNGAID